MDRQYKGSFSSELTQPLSKLVQDSLGETRLPALPREFALIVEVEMGLLKRFFKSVFHEGVSGTQVGSSFEHLSEDELDAHLGVADTATLNLPTPSGPHTTCRSFRGRAFATMSTLTTIPKPACPC